MTPRETLLAVARILQLADLDAKVAFAFARHPLLTVGGDIAARVTDSGAIVVQCVRNGDAILLGAHTCRRETVEEIAKSVQVRQLLVDAVEQARRDSLTPEQRAAEDHVCAGCDLRAPLPGLAKCGRCVEKAA